MALLINLYSTSHALAYRVTYKSNIQWQVDFKYTMNVLTDACSWVNYSYQ